MAVFVLGLTVSCNDPLLTRSLSHDPLRNYPGGFVIMALRAGLPLLASFINAIMIVAAVSVATVNLFVAVISPSSPMQSNSYRVSLYKLWQTKTWLHPFSNLIKFTRSSSRLILIGRTDSEHKILSCKSISVGCCTAVS